ncbi:MAG: alpha/beta fold hydrolase [Desulfobacterales bacterium]|nr:MAG: alpha/beta fold hydrolase [Desulfobacterales bacterium]
MNSKKTHPIILAHGIARFDVGWNELFQLDNQDDPFLDFFHYYRGIRTMLIKHGFTVYHSSVPWAERVDKRAEQLRKNVRNVLEQTGAEKVNIIAHSMGGLDARHMLFNDRNKGKIHQRLASLTTIGTPHLGTSFADKGIGEHGELIEILKRLSLNIEGVRDLTRDACSSFNDNPEVKVFENELEKHTELRAYTGSASIDNVLAILRKPYKIIKEEEGDNDGLVSVNSALWEKASYKGIWKDTDHLNELAWWDFEQAGTEGFFALTKRIHNKYLEIARQLPGIT